MAVYKRIVFQKSKRNSSTPIEEKTPVLETTPSEGNKIKEFYESLIAMETKPITSESSPTLRSSNVKHLKRTKKPRKAIKEIKLNSFLKAAEKGDLKSAKEFVELQKSDINMKDDFGWTALMCACCNGQTEMVNYLLNHGAEWMDIKDKSGTDAMDLAQRAGHNKVINLLRNNGILCNTPESTKEFPKPFYCDSCDINVETSTRNEHTSSTVHQFCMQHTKQSTLYYLNDSNKGYQMMLKDGWDSEKGLGPEGSGMKFPIKTTLKRDRQCLGSDLKECRPRITHFKPFDTSAVKRQREIRKPLKQSSPLKRINKMKTRKWEIEYRQSWNSETS